MSDPERDPERLAVLNLAVVAWDHAQRLKGGSFPPSPDAPNQAVDRFEQSVNAWKASPTPTAAAAAISIALIALDQLRPGGMQSPLPNARDAQAIERLVEGLKLIIEGMR